MTENRQSIVILIMSALSFTVCFALWTMNGVLITWMFFAFLTVVCLTWMHLVVTRMMNRRAPRLMRQIDEVSTEVPVLAGSQLNGKTVGTPVESWANMQAALTVKGE